MEQNATDEDRKKDSGMDIADFLERYPSREFNPQLLTPPVIEAPAVTPKTKVVQEVPEPPISEEQTAIHRLVEKYPITSKLIERLKLDEKKVSYLYSQEDWKVIRKNQI